MERKLKILLIEDDPVECQAITQAINLKDDIFLIGATNNIFKALELVQEGLPDAIILDLELHKGNGNGLEFLRKLNTLTIPIVPFVLITTHNTSSVTYEYARELGADFILCKNQEDYSAKNVVDFLYSMKKSLHNKRILNSELAEENQVLAQEIESKQKRRIINELNYIGISPKSIAFKYFIDAILMCINNSNADFKAEISKKYGKTIKSVERVMQNAISVAWSNTPIDDLSKYYTARVSPKRGIPTLMEFVYYYACKLNS